MGVETAAITSGLGAAAGWGGSALSMAAPFVGPVAGVLSSIQEAEKKKKWAKYQSKQAKADAYASLGAARVEAQKIREAAGTVQGESVASVAGSGAVVGDGSAGLIEKVIRQRAEEDALMALFDGEDAFKRGMAQAKSYKLQGKTSLLEMFSGKGTGALLGAAGGGLTSLSGWLTGTGKSE